MSIALGAALISVTGYQTLLAAMATTIALAAACLLTRQEQHHAPAQQAPPPRRCDHNPDSDPAIRNAEHWHHPLVSYPP
jgi:hypothetical protein